MLTEKNTARLRLMADRITEMRATLRDPDVIEGADDDEGEALDDAAEHLRAAWLALTLFT